MNECIENLICKVLQVRKEVERAAYERITLRFKFIVNLK